MVHRPRPPPQAAGKGNGQMTLYNSDGDVAGSVQPFAAPVCGVAVDAAGAFAATCSGVADGAVSSGGQDAASATVQLTRIASGKSSAFTLPEPVTCVAFPPDFSVESNHSLWVGTAAGGVYRVRKQGSGWFARDACEELCREKGAVFAVQQHGSRLAWVSCRGVKVQDLGSKQRVLVDKPALEPAVAACIGMRAPPRLQWLGPHALAAAWGDTLHVYLLLPGRDPARTATFTLHGHVVGLAPYGPSFLAAVVMSGEAHPLQLCILPRVRRGDAQPAHTTQLPLPSHAQPILPKDVSLAFVDRGGSAPVKEGVSTPGTSSALPDLLVASGGGITRLQPRTPLDHVDWCFLHGLYTRALVTARRLGHVPAQRAVQLLQSHVGACFVHGAASDALRTLDPALLWALPEGRALPTYASGGSSSGVLQSLSDLFTFKPAGDAAAEHGSALLRYTGHARSYRLQWLAWTAVCCGLVPILSLSQEPEDALWATALDAQGSLADLAAHAGTLAARGVALAPDTPAATVDRAVARLRTRLSKQSAAEASKADELVKDEGDRGQCVWGVLQAGMLRAITAKPLWVASAKAQDALVSALLEAIPLVTPPLPLLVYEALLHHITWHRPEVLQQCLLAWSAVRGERGGEACLYDVPSIVAMLQDALRHRSRAAAESPGEEGVTFSVPPYVPSKAATHELHMAFACSHVPCPVVHFPQPPSGPNVAVEPWSEAQDWPDQAEAEAGPPRSGGALQTEPLQRVRQEDSVLFQSNTVKLLDALAELLMRTGQHKLALRVILQRAAASPHDTRPPHEQPVAAAGQSGARRDAMSLLPPSSGQYSFVFRIIRGQGLQAEVANSVRELTALDARAALTYLAANRRSAPPLVVAEQLLGCSVATPGIPEALSVEEVLTASGATPEHLKQLVTYFLILRQQPSTWEAVCRPEGAPWLTLVGSLLAHFLPEDFLPFLQACKQVDDGHLLRVVQKLNASSGDRWLEIAFLLQRTGALSASLDLLVGRLQDVAQAVKFVQLVEESAAPKPRPKHGHVGHLPPVDSHWGALLQRIADAPESEQPHLWAQLLDELPHAGHLQAGPALAAITSLQPIPGVVARLVGLLRAQRHTESMHGTVLEGAKQELSEKHLDFMFAVSRGVFVPHDAACSLSGLPLSASGAGDTAPGMLRDDVGDANHLRAALERMQAFRERQARLSATWEGTGTTASSVSSGQSSVPAPRAAVRSAPPTSTAPAHWQRARRSRGSSAGSFSGSLRGLPGDGQGNALSAADAIITWSGQHYLVGALRRHAPVASSQLQAKGGLALPTGLLRQDEGADGD